ncbi:MAG TPA: pilus assembly protein TadG-related protein [Nocardioidaceae bacterium]|nr:pilus assembly protein TadG-related protein [Nocardioidaceae bacterium]
MMASLRPRRDEEDGYVAVFVALLMVVLVGMAAFTVDVGQWYVTGQQAQRAADAAALGGVPELPDDQPDAFAAAQQLAAANGFQDGVETATVTPAIDGQPTRLRVTVSRTVDNIFGPLLGLDQTTITRTAVADYAGPVAMGSPCNQFGNDPEATSASRSAACEDTGEFWANVGSLRATKQSGDAFQNGVCSGGDDGCTGSTNDDYDPNGYFYTVTLSRAVSNLQLEAFDPALINVGDLCTQNLTGAAAIPAASTDPGTEPSQRYKAGPDSPYCTGDVRFGGTGQVATEFTVREMTDASDPWDPLSYPVVSGCQQTFPGFNGALAEKLNRSVATYDAYVASVFRRWRPLCTIPAADAGTYLIQVKTNGVGADAASGHNRFGLRGWSSGDSSAKDAIAIAGYNKMAVYANLPSATTLFHLARLPSGSGGQVLNVRLFDVGDSSNTGTIQVVAPDGFDFSGCKGYGPQGGVSGTDLPTCSVTANSSSFQGKWQTIAVPIPDDYGCDDEDPTACWAKLQYSYGSGNQPTDTTSWQASIEGDPVRLVE